MYEFAQPGLRGGDTRFLSAVDAAAALVDLSQTCRRTTW